MVRPCSDEKISQSQYPSPGPVEDEEDLIYIIISPVHITPNGSGLKPSAFQRSHLDDKNQGVSVERRQHADPDVVRDRAKSLAAKKPDRNIAGYVMANCGKMRRIKDNYSQQGFTVIDTAQKHDPAHADIHFAQNYTNNKRPFQNELRSKLVELFSEHLNRTSRLNQIIDLF